MGPGVGRDPSHGHRRQGRRRRGPEVHYEDGAPRGHGRLDHLQQTALKNFAAGKYDREKVFVIAKEPETILHLVESGIELPSLIVGGSLVKEGGVQLTQRAYASAENVQSYKALIAHGIKVTAQFVPADKPVSVADLI